MITQEQESLGIKVEPAIVENRGPAFQEYTVYKEGGEKK